MNKKKRKDFSFYTFATLGDEGKYRDYSSRYLALKDNLLSFGFELHLIRLTDLVFDMNVTQRRIVDLKKGVGYWTWKPNALLYALAHCKTEYTIYIDCDLFFASDPTDTLENAFKESNLVLYKQSVPLASNTSATCMSYFDVPSKNEFSMWSASLIGFRKHDKELEDFLYRWKDYCSDPKLLIEPLSDLTRRHRHDQSILSCLIAKQEFRVSDLGHGFYSKGPENRNTNPNTRVVIHGENREAGKLVLRRIKEMIGFSFHKVSLVVWKIKNKGLV